MKSRRSTAYVLYYYDCLFDIRNIILREKIKICNLPTCVCIITYERNGGDCGAADVRKSSARAHTHTDTHTDLRQTANTYYRLSLAKLLCRQCAGIYCCEALANDDGDYDGL